MTEITDLRLDPDGDLATRYETPHGVLRTLLYPATETSQGHIARLSLRYDDQRLVVVLALGRYAVPLADQTVGWLWDHFPDPMTDAQTFIDLVSGFLQGDARQVGEGGETHSIVLGAISREDETGRIWLSWLGTGGVRALDIEREPLPIAKGLVAGEGWSPQHGIAPGRALPHGEVLAINAIDRLLFFTSVMRPTIDEIPYLGRATLQRVAEAHAEALPAVVFDLSPYRVVPPPERMNLRYRWEDPFEATLFWSASKNATGYRVEQSSTLAFEDASTLAELADARQRVYRVQPPVDEEIYYRVVPFDKDVAGQPSSPVVVTPVPLVPPVIEEITWLDSGSFFIRWSSLPQANWYELEASPEADFDSPQTAIVHRGEEASFETATNFPPGWYYRVRSLNTYYAPKSPSPWSEVRRAPERLMVPTFVQVATSQISWTPVPGARLYEVQQVVMRDGKPVVENVGLFEDAFLKPQENGVYQVRALRAKDDMATASPWSQGVTIGYSQDAMSAETAKIPVLDNVKTATLPRAAAREIDPKRATLETEPVSVQAAPPNMLWRVVLITAALAVAIGLIVGLVGGPRLGIGMDDTPTSVPQADREATATQAHVFAAQATERAVFQQSLHQAEALATEIGHDLTNETNRNATLSVELANQQATAMANAEQMSFLNSRKAVAETQVMNLQATTTQQSIALAGTSQAGIEQIGTLEALNNSADSHINALNATVTSYDAAIATLDSDMVANSLVVATLEAELAEQSSTIDELQSQADRYIMTITALAPTLTPKPSVTPTPTDTPTVTPTQTPLTDWLGG